MNPVDEKTATLDAHARQLHAASLSRLSPQTLSKLRAARHAAQAGDAPVRTGHWRWLTATAFTAVFAVGIGLQLMSPDASQPAPGEQPAGAVIASATLQDEFSDATLLDEDPDLYLWLASAEAQPLAVESIP
jgi:anti-sigma-K factor RskA